MGGRTFSADTWKYIRSQLGFLSPVGVGEEFLVQTPGSTWGHCRRVLSYMVPSACIHVLRQMRLSMGKILVVSFILPHLGELDKERRGGQSKIRVKQSEELISLA